MSRSSGEDSSKPDYVNGKVQLQSETSSDSQSRSHSLEFFQEQFQRHSTIFHLQQSQVTPPPQSQNSSKSQATASSQNRSQPPSSQSLQARPPSNEESTPHKEMKREIDSSTFVQAKSGLRLVTNFTFNIRDFTCI